MARPGSGPYRSGCSHRGSDLAGERAGEGGDPYREIRWLREDRRLIAAPTGSAETTIKCAIRHALFPGRLYKSGKIPYNTRSLCKF